MGENHQTPGSGVVILLGRLGYKVVSYLIYLDVIENSVGLLSCDLWPQYLLSTHHVLHSRDLLLWLRRGSHAHVALIFVFHVLGYP